MFEDEETRAFYESLVDLRAVVPAVLLGEKGGAKDGDGDAAAAASGGGSEQPPAAADAEGGAGKDAAAAGGKQEGSKQEPSGYEDILEVGVGCACFHEQFAVWLLPERGSLAEACAGKPCTSRPFVFRGAPNLAPLDDPPPVSPPARARRGSPASWTCCWAACPPA